MKLYGPEPPVVAVKKFTGSPAIGLSGPKLKSTLGKGFTVIVTLAAVVTPTSSVTVTVAVKVPVPV